MNSITQVMIFRRSMVEYALKHGVTKTPSNTIHIANMYIAGFDVMMVHWSPYVINPAGQNTIPKHIQLRN